MWNGWASWVQKRITGGPAPVWISEVTQVEEALRGHVLPPRQDIAWDVHANQRQHCRWGWGKKPAWSCSSNPCWFFLPSTWRNARKAQWLHFVGVRTTKTPHATELPDISHIGRRGFGKKLGDRTYSRCHCILCLARWQWQQVSLFHFSVPMPHSRSLRRVLCTTLVGQISFGVPSLSARLACLAAAARAFATLHWFHKCCQYAHTSANQNILGSVLWGARPKARKRSWPD